jgi:hypothetical protein
MPRSISSSSMPARTAAPIFVFSRNSQSSSASPQTDADQEQPVGGIGNAEKLDGTAEQRRLRQHHGIAAPYPERRVGEDEKQAERQQRLRQLLLVKLGQEHALDAHAQRRDQHEADDRSQDEIAAPLHHAERDVSAQQVK